MHSEGGSIVQQGSGYSGRVATVLPVQYPKKGKYKSIPHTGMHWCVLFACVQHKCVSLSGFNFGVGGTT